MNCTTDELSFVVPLSFEAHGIAQECSKGIPKEKVQQVYLNSLAVYAVDNYLRCMGFKTDWENSDSRNSLAIKLMNIADLEVKNIGKLECRPLLVDEEKVEIPTEVSDDRIGYVAVQFDSSLKTAKILGFTHNYAAEIPLNQLQSLEDFLMYLTECEVVKSHQLTVARIGEWIDGIVDATWEKLDRLLTPQQLGVAFKSEISIIRGQKIDLGIQLDQISLALVLRVTPEENSNEVSILTQLHPFKGITLPEGVKLIISDELGEVVLEQESREDDNWIQSAFDVELGEKFKIGVSYKENLVEREFEF
ncbi:MAG: DUF1822 family protein [Richelia sp. RM2_1_2]|nr:DUF1822 family protein [Richelia sp. RM2_1_2]